MIFGWIWPVICDEGLAYTLNGSTACSFNQVIKSFCGFWPILLMDFLGEGSEEVVLVAAAVGIKKGVIREFTEVEESIQHWKDELAFWWVLVVTPSHLASAAPNNPEKRKFWAVVDWCGIQEVSEKDRDWQVGRWECHRVWCGCMNRHQQSDFAVPWTTGYSGKIPFLPWRWQKSALTLNEQFVRPLLQSWNDGATPVSLCCHQCWDSNHPVKHHWIRTHPRLFQLCMPGTPGNWWIWIRCNHLGSCNARLGQFSSCNCWGHVHKHQSVWCGQEALTQLC